MIKENESQIWFAPEKKDDSFITGLKLNNSLWSQEKTEFIPLEGNKIKWYMCGPTVYSDSHLGHAKTYLCFDTIRKTLTRYFGYEVFQVMNITDIEDKIIKRALEENKPPKEVTSHWEKDFFDIYQKLEIDPPNVVTRVTEFVKEIVEYIEKIISNGFAYESNGSVYFDVAKYQQDGRFMYPILRPCVQKTDQEQQQNPNDEDNEFLNEKRNKQDFVLWKKSKENEPMYESPWGYGRPGWHIECSVMCSSVFSGQFDIHSGGEDLKFPHHDNEIAQSQAHDQIKQWANYWIHTGHMNIQGQKMSKSLKNFIKIKSILENVTPRILRIFYNLKNYDAVLNYSPEDDFVQAWNIDKQFEEFFALMKFKLKNSYDLIANQEQKMNEQDEHIYILFQSVQKEIHEALLNNLQIPVCINILQGFMKEITKYISNQNIQPKFPLAQNVTNFVKRIMYCFGIEYKEQQATESQEEALIQLFVDFWEDIRKVLQKIENKEQKKEMFQISDKYREQMLQQFSVKIEDMSNVWKKVTYNKKDNKEVEGTTIVQKNKVEHPDELYQIGGALEKFRTYIKDEQGLPIKDINGEEISKKNWQYAEKIYNQQKRKYEDSLKKI